MNWLKKLIGTKEENKSSNVAKARLQMVLTHDRNALSPGLIEEIKNDIIQVIAARVSIDPENVVVNLTQDQRESRLVAEIPILNGRRDTTNS
ncbi:MAG TPA: cell division topological specificity factor MinE [Anaerolineae bacterium]|nr:cell division topological specificity factor MinE [Anaerolineae bacterium]